MRVNVDMGQFEARPADKYSEYISDNYLTLGDVSQRITFETGNYLWIAIISEAEIIRRSQIGG